MVKSKSIFLNMFRIRTLVNARANCYRRASSVTTVKAKTVESKVETSDGRMWSWVVHGYGLPSEMRLERMRMPRLSAPDEVLVRVHAASINPLDVAMIGGYGSEILNTLRAAESACDRSEGWNSGVEFPLVVGRDFLGSVEAVGVHVREELAPGTRVWGALSPQRVGSLRQWIVVDQCSVAPAPAALGPEAAAVPYAGLSAMAALRAAGLVGSGSLDRVGSARVLVLGLGGVGAVLLQTLASRGMTTRVGCAGDQTALALSLGAAEVLVREDPDYERRLVECGPYDVIIDCAGLGGEYAGSLSWRFSRYVTLTSPLLRHTDRRGLLVGSLAAVADWVQQSAAVADARSDGGSDVRWAYFCPRLQDLRSLGRLADNGQLTMPVRETFSWREADVAMARAASGSRRGKLLVDFTAP